MNRIDRVFADLRAAGRKALIPYITVGDPHPADTVPLMHALVAAGANLIELGVPFSDPMADGPVIQAACERALAQGMSLTQVLDLVRAFRATDDKTPVVLMGYLNPIERMGYTDFARRAQEAGADGVLAVDLPPEEGSTLLAALRARALSSIFLLAPNSTPARMASICAAASGFIYYVSLKGVTGAAHLDVDAVARKLDEIRTLTTLPLGVGFGIKDAATAQRIGAVADAVIVGSALVSMIARLGSSAALFSEVPAMLASMRKALDEGPDLKLQLRRG